MIYLDSSALVKRYVAETGTELSLSPITFACADDQLNAIATAEGFVTDNPNLHL